MLHRFDELAAMFQAGGHVFGDALVRWAVARPLLNYGKSAGLALAHAAAAGFAAADVPSSELQVWSALQFWYTVHGDQARSREAETHAAQLVPGMGFTLAAECASSTRRTRPSDPVRRPGQALLARLSRSSPSLQAASRVMLATTANAVGMRAEDPGSCSKGLSRT